MADRRVMTELSHIDEKGKARMVDVSGKAETRREAEAIGFVRMRPETLELVKKAEIKKGDVLATSRLAGIMAAKKTAELIPLCHIILIENVSVDFEFVGDNSIKIMARAVSTGKTGVEMEAMVAASVSALTIYDMCKAVDRGITIEKVYLQKKSGGKSGTYTRGEED